MAQINLGKVVGDSAYETAVINGFEGTEAEWLASLVGPTGATGETGATGATGATGQPGVTETELNAAIQAAIYSAWEAEY